MDQGLQRLKEASKTIKRFTDLKRSGFFSARLFNVFYFSSDFRHPWI